MRDGAIGIRARTRTRRVRRRRQIERDALFEDGVLEQATGEGRWTGLAFPHFVLARFVPSQSARASSSGAVEPYGATSTAIGGVSVHERHVPLFVGRVRAAVGPVRVPHGRARRVHGGVFHEFGGGGRALFSSATEEEDGEGDEDEEDHAADDGAGDDRGQAGTAATRGGRGCATGDHTGLRTRGCHAFECGCCEGRVACCDRERSCDRKFWLVVMDHPRGEILQWYFIGSGGYTGNRMSGREREGGNGGVRVE